MKTFALFVTLFVALAFTEALDDKKYMVGYLTTLGGTATEEELSAKPLPELIDMVVETLKKRQAEEKDPKQVELIGNHISYFDHLKSRPNDSPAASAAANDSPAANPQPARSQAAESSSDVTEVQHIESEEDFDEQVKKAGSKLVVVDFFATWCGPCKRIAPVLDTFAKTYASQIVILKVDVDQLNELAMVKYNVDSMPTFVFLKDGKTVERFSGADAEGIENTIKKFSA